MENNLPQVDESARATPTHIHYCPNCSRQYYGYREARKCKEPRELICGPCLAKTFIPRTKKSLTHAQQ